MNDTDAVRTLGALANTTRLTLVRSLVTAGPSGMIAGELATTIGASPSRTSFHLATLAEAGLIEATREAREIRYRVSFQRLGDLVAFILEDCCQGSADLRACCAPLAKR